MSLKLLADFVTEARMGGKELKNTLDAYSDTALVGFEFECYVTKDSSFFADSSGSFEGQEVDLEDISYHDLESYFIIDPATSKRLEAAYKKWLSNFEDGDTDEADEDMWIAEEFSGISQFIHYFNLVPANAASDVDAGYVIPADLEINDEEQFAACAAELASGLKTYLGLHDVKIADEPKSLSPKIGDSFWVITTDNSLTSSKDQVGVEIVTNPMPLKLALARLEKFYDFCKKKHIKTDHSTGLHVNISVSGMRTRFDPLKLICFIGEQKMLAEFGRTNNTYTMPHVTSLDGIIELMKKDSFEEMKAKARAMIKGSPKYRTVNFNKLHSGYLEFRIIGGDYLSFPYVQVKNAIAKFVFACAIATNPEAEKQEYAKKLFKIMSASWESDPLADKEEKLKNKQ